MDDFAVDGFFKLIEGEAQRRRAQINALPDDNTGFGYDEWTFKHVPFLNDLCLLFLVGLSHHVERELLLYAARSEDQGQLINRETLEKRKEALLKTKDFKETIKKRLNLEQAKNYQIIEALRLLANSYKHDPRKGPTKVLLKHLKLDLKPNYNELGYSWALEDGLAKFVGAPEKSGYSLIAKRFVECVSEFLKDVTTTHNKLSPVQYGVSLNPEAFLV